jgi:multidrug transporter EmrE-like cation transporter
MHPLVKAVGVVVVVAVGFVCCVPVGIKLFNQVVDVDERNALVLVVCGGLDVNVLGERQVNGRNHGVK